MALQNNLIERIQVEVDARVKYPIKAIMNELVHTDTLDISDDSTKFYISRVSEYDLKMFVNSWNHHTTPSTFLLICSKILIKQDPTCLFLFETRLFVLCVCSKYDIDNGVPHFTQKTCFLKFNPAGTERSFDINPTSITYKQHSMDVNTMLCACWEHFSDLFLLSCSTCFDIQM